MTGISASSYRYFGRTGVQVSPIALGAMNFGDWANNDPDQGIRIVRESLDSGINIIDTADVYSQGASESIVGEALSGGRRDEVFLATKFHGPMGTAPNRKGNSRLWLMRAVEESLERLRTDHIDLYQIHKPEDVTDLEETLAALDDLVRSGKIRYYGTTTFEPHDLVEAQWISQRRRLHRPVSEQPPYSILVRGAERATLPLAQKHGLGVLTWSPLAGGWLSGRHEEGTPTPVSTRLGRQPHRHDPEITVNQRKRELAIELGNLAREAGIPLAQLSIAFVLQHPAVSSVLLGPRTLQQLHDLLPAVDLVLDDSLLDAIDEIVAPGENVSRADEGYVPSSLTNTLLRRRSVPRSA
ncbi:aldo/keto reductase [Rhodococcus globerulus]|uniref:Aldo/keto reductase n=1 Tax=Rhodococcus globerulus TaxID=33008 RepID=A0ABU4C3B6_RHOGO|nr:aldo/keto reductase [Rhodococcus globerulus]MDV6270996.1 aldo/keto reductase [Rhodococcus globerulus]